MSDLYIVDPGDFGAGGDDIRAGQAAERAKARASHVGRLLDAGVDIPTAELVVATIFDHFDDSGAPCLCGCHPQLSAQHEAGTDCRCTWDAERRAAEHAKWRAWWDSPESRWLAEHHATEEQAIADWIAGQQDVAAVRTTSYAPEQWDGVVDGRSFYFRERHQMWQLELDMQPSGRFANRWVGTNEDAEMITEPVELTEGTVIAEGVDTELGDGPVEHLAFIVRAIRDHMGRESCDHAGALLFCPKCGTRTTEP